ncbi:hypothetical protein [Methanobrevibacter sp.]|uniref:hypothetical protein n=1 Tax=Methanobrevibacter sp. TaxID=66852 RepID=UPI003865C8ED
MLTEAITTLGKSEEWFWDSELRIVWNLIMEKRRLDEIRMKNQAIYIASYVWGHEPDEEEEEKEVAGRDKPIDEGMLRGLF